MDKVPRQNACTGPQEVSVQIKTSMGQDGPVPVMNVAWDLKADASIYRIHGTEIKVTEENTNQSVCVQFHYSVGDLLNPSHKRWTFSLDVLVEPKHTYTTVVLNLPEPQKGHYRMTNRTTIPGCEDQRIKKAQLCQENGSLWDPRITVFTEKENLILVEFYSSEFSERYRVFIQSGSLNDSQWVFKIQPFFIRCKNNCESARKTVKLSQSCIFASGSSTTGSKFMEICLVLLLIFVGFLVYFLQKASRRGPPATSPSADQQQPEVVQVQERKRVLVIYSLDHLLYKNIVLKLASFLAAKCGTDVVLDMLDSTRLGVLGSIQWLEWHKEQIERSSDKILILCSRGVKAKWRAMCGGKQVFLREDVLSPIGDTLTPSLTLLVPYFIRSASFEKYIVAYFDDIFSEEDIPLPFKITVRYKLMKQFEEVFFRILNTEKHEPGRVKQIDGLSEDTYHECPSGKALKDAIEAFHEYQLENPHWFQEELLECPELVDEEAPAASDEKQIMTITDHLTYSVLNSVQVISDMEIQDCAVTVNKPNVQVVETHQTCSTLEFNSHTVEGIRLV
ncbi:hypothetical protein CRENBAI_015324 [Crenichthys baileyi]|uniref:SEFIR domain-containing protein n=1 Tax=Crenichthys baileyi TaxID=28760 RepID=A0AAV9R462_9TELE